MCATSCDFCAEQSENSSCQSVKKLCNCDSLFVVKLAKKIEASDTIPAQNTEEIALPDTSTQDSTPEINSLDSVHAVSEVAEKSPQKNEDSLRIYYLEQQFNMLKQVVADLLAAKDSAEQNIAKENSIKTPADTVPTDFITRAYSQKMHRGIFVDFSLNCVKLGLDSYWSDFAFSVNFGYFKRFYFYKYGSIQWGLGLNYDYANGWLDDYYSRYDGIDWEYHEMGLFAPITLRIGAPFVFASASMVVKKPVYEWITTGYGNIEYTDQIYYRDYYGSSYTTYNDYTIPEKTVKGISSPGDWQFLFLFGVGFDIFRRVTLEVQFGTGLSTGFEPIEYRDLEEPGIIRFNVEYLW